MELLIIAALVLIFILLCPKGSFETFTPDEQATKALMERAEKGCYKAQKALWRRSRKK